MSLSGSALAGTKRKRRVTKPCAIKHRASNRQGVSLATQLCSFDEVVRELGGNPDSLLEAAGITPSALNDPSARIPFRTMGQLLEDTAAQLGCADFGMRLAERQSIQATMQPLDRLYCTAPTLRDAFECSIRHVDAFNSGLIIELDDRFRSDLNFLHFELVDAMSLFPQMAEQLMLLTHNSGIWLTAGFARSRTVWFSHINISPPVAYAQRFNTVVKFGQVYDGLFFSDEDLQTKVVDCDVERFASEARVIAERFPAQRKDIDLKVRQAVVRLLTSSESCTRGNIAGLLGLQERTLNRRLSKRGTSFEAIRDEVRRSLAFRYLARNDLSLTEIAGRLGYSELAVLSRSSRRWFGVPPRKLRQKLLSAGTAATV